MSTLTLLINATCSTHSNVSPANQLEVTLKPGESYQVKVNDDMYTIVYNDTQVKFSEGLVESDISYTYERGEVKITVNQDPISLRAEAHYDNKGGRQPRSWVYLQDSQGIATIGSIAVGVANFYPVSSDLSTNNGYKVEFLIQPQ